MFNVCSSLLLFTLTFCAPCTRSMYLTTESTNVSSVSHFIDENGVRVEKDIADAIVIQSGESEGEEYDSEEDSNSQENTMSFTSPGNILDIFTALHTAWREVEKFREENKNRSMISDQTTEEDRSRRNSIFGNSTGNNFNVSEIVVPLTPKPLSSVSEARYIKGDPLKGYYDFVITEGSYKFWAAFQLATAALVIYSTFAAIYYSKVNPIVGDYDYVEYLGGGRSLSDSYADYEDPTDNEEKLPNTHNLTDLKQQKNFKSFWPNLSLGSWSLQNINLKNGAKSILEAIDKLS